MTNEGDAEEGIYDLPGVPWCSFFTGTGVAIHGTYWHNDYGRPRSHGCVNLPSMDAKFIYAGPARSSRPESITCTCRAREQPFKSPHLHSTRTTGKK
jgi:hypothetical protein